MILKITSIRQVTFPAHVLIAMGVGSGDYLEIQESPEGYLLKPKRIDQSRLAPLRNLIPDDYPSLDIGKFRERTYDPAIRD